MKTALTIYILLVTAGVLLLLLAGDLILKTIGGALAVVALIGAVKFAREIRNKA